MVSHAAAERAEFVAALQAVPAGAPTLCAGWTALDLAAHVVARERRPDSTPGLMIPALAGWTDRVRNGYARRPYPELIELVAGGPPRTSLFALPGVDAAANFGEFLIHTEDVRRAQPGWEPRDLDADRREAAWSAVRRGSRLYFRKVPVALVLARPDGADGTEIAAGARNAADGEPVRVVGEPEELLLLAAGRRTHARVTVTGHPDAVRLFEATPLSL